jgi:hypothetical protein
MPEDCPKPDRRWREIAGEVATEGDPDKVIELSEELLKALDKKNNRSPQQHTPEHADEQARRKSA